MGYYIDLEKISLDDYRRKLETAYLPPSRMILKERLDERMECFKSIGIKNVKALIGLLKNKKKIDELSLIECFHGDYLTILLRELNSTLPKPNKIADFAGIPKNTIEKLAQAGIKTTEKLYEKVIRQSDRKTLCETTRINEQDIMELTKLTDLSRIKWVGVTFARMLYDVGVDTVEKAANADPVELHVKINHHNRERSIYKGQIGLNDIHIFINAAKEIPQEIEY